MGFDSLTGIEVLSLSDDANIVALDTLKSTDTALSSVFGGKGDDAFTAAILGDVFLSAGDGSDTLSLSGALDASADFSKVTGIEILSLAGGDAVNLDNVAPSGITLVAEAEGATASTFTASADTLAAVSLQGSGSDTLSLTGAITDGAALSLVSGVSVLSLSGANSLDLSALKASDGTGTDTVLASVFGGNGADSFSSDKLGDLALEGGQGSDTLLLNEAITSTADFSKVSGIEVLSLAGGDIVDLSKLADAGISKVASEDATDASTYLASTDALSKVAISAGSGEDTLALTEAVTADTDFSKVSGIEILSLFGGDELKLNDLPFGLTDIFGGAEGSSFLLPRLDAIQVHGGKGEDTLVFSQGNQIFQDYSGLSDIEVLSLTGSNSVTFNSSAQECHLSTVIGGTGRLVTNQLADNSDELYIDASAGSDGLFEFSSFLFAGLGTIKGGAGRDSLLVDEGGTADDALFQNIHDVDFLRLAGTNSLVLGSFAAAAHLVSIQGGFGNDSITIDANDTLGHWINEKSSMSFQLTVPDPARLGFDSVTANGFASTLSVGLGSSGSVVSLGDSSFAHLSGFTDLQLAGSANLTLGSAAAGSGIRSVAMNGGTFALTQTAGNLQGYRIDGTAVDLLSVSVASASLLASDTLIGSASSSDSLTVGTGAVTDRYFTAVSGFENLVLSGSMAVTLGAKAFTTGIQSVYGGSGSSTIVQTSDDYNAMLLDGSAGSNNLFNLGDPGLVSNDTLIGGGGVNTLTFGSPGLLDADALAHVTGIQVLKMANGSNTLTVGSNTDLRTVIGGTLNDYIDGSALSVLASAPGMTLDGGGSAAFADTLTGSEGADLFVLGGSAGTSYATTDTGTANFAYITNLSSNSLLGGSDAGDRLQLSQADRAKYTLGIPAHNGLKTSTHFGLYDNGKFVADISTSGFEVPTDDSRNAAFLDPLNNHVVYV